MATPLAAGQGRFEELAHRFGLPGERTLLPGPIWAAAIYAVTLVPVLVLLTAAWFQPFVPLGELMRDSLLVAEVSQDCCHIYYGAISNVGVLLWASAAAVLIFSALVVALIGGQENRHHIIQFFLAGGLTMLLCIDDFFLVHDIVLPKLGFSETLAYAVYATIAAIYVWYARREILAARWLMFLISVACLALSVKIDVFLNLDNDFRLLIEDGAKLMGIAAWLSFHAEAAACTIQRLCETGSTPAQQAGTR
ncbi:MAG: hypothetical protein HEP70_15515 [Rhodobiaceae bacterium]|nr:hypothetical protein [Rhodobiaceae bacterium]